MKSKGLTSGDYNLRKSEKSLTDSFLKSQEIFLPILQRKNREDIIRKNLAIMQKYSLLFGLGQKMENSMIIGDYSKAVQDYRQAKLSLKAAMERDPQLGAILEKVWKNHEGGSIKLFIEKLSCRLVSSVFSFDVHEKIIELLLQMDHQLNPIDLYFQSRKKALLDSIQSASLQTSNDLKDLEKDVESSKKILSDILFLLQTGRVNTVLSTHYSCVRSWRRREGFFRILKELCNDFFPSFGKFLAMFNNNNNTDSNVKDQQKSWTSNSSSFHPPLTFSSASASASQSTFNSLSSFSKLDEYKITGFADEFYATMSSCMKIMLDLELIADNIRDCSIPNALSLFKIISGSMENASSNVHGKEKEKEKEIEWERGKSHMAEMTAIIRESQVHPIFLERFKQLTEEIKREAIQSIWKCAKRDILDLHLMEDWRYNPLGLSTGLIQSFEIFLFFILDSIKALLPFSNSASNSHSHSSASFPSLEKISLDLISCFIDSLANLTDLKNEMGGERGKSLSLLTRNDDSIVMTDSNTTKITNASQSTLNSNSNDNKSGNRNRNDNKSGNDNRNDNRNDNTSTDLNTTSKSSFSGSNSSLKRMGLGYRLLIMIANISFMNNKFPLKLREKYQIDDHGSIKKLMEKAIKKAKEQYLFCNINRLSLIVENGLFTELDSSLPPRDLRPYLYNILLQLISIQTEICDISPNLLRLLISEILLAILNHVYKLLEGGGGGGSSLNSSNSHSSSIPFIQSLSFNGYLQLKLEIDYLQQRMVTCLGSEGQELIAKINVAIERRVKEEMPTQRDIREIIESKLDNIINKTVLQFSCFQYT